jgi:PAS domain S-box-containing protein
VIEPDDLTAAEALFGSLLSGAEAAVETTMRVCRPSGEARWVRIDAVAIRHAGEVAGAHGIARDITHERERESRMRLFAAALENLTESVNVLDDRGRILYANTAHARMLGHDPGRAGEVGAFASDEIRPVLAEARERGVWRGLLQLRREDGTPIAVDAHMERLEQEGHSLIFTISRDVGDELEREHRLRRAERLATIGTLVGGVAHELNNPLAAIVGFTQLLLMDERTASEREDLETIRREAERMAEIVANLRMLARDTPESRPGREAVDVADVLRHVLRTRAYALRTHNVRVSEEIDPELPAVMGDRSQLEQVVLNLVVNAEQAMATCDRPGVLVVGARPSGTGVALHVSDNGPGIAPGHLQRIFDPFFTTKGPGEGTGLGLSLVHNLVAEHGGEVRVESRPGAGATFRVDLPATARAVAPPREAGEAPPSAPRRILVVDDETSVRRVIARSLARRGHRVDEAAEGGEALGLVDAARGAGDSYDLIISDLRMPGLDGMQLLARLRQQDETMAERLVFLTGDTADEACMRIRSEARIPVLTKPIDMTELARVVAAATA